MLPACWLVMALRRDDKRQGLLRGPLVALVAACVLEVNGHRPVWPLRARSHTLLAATISTSVQSA